MLSISSLLVLVVSFQKQRARSPSFFWVHSRHIAASCRQTFPHKGQLRMAFGLCKRTNAPLKKPFASSKILYKSQLRTTPLTHTLKQTQQVFLLNLQTSIGIPSKTWNPHRLQNRSLCDGLRPHSMATESLPAKEDTNFWVLCSIVFQKHQSGKLTHFCGVDSTKHAFKITPKVQSPRLLLDLFSKHPLI